MSLISKIHILGAPGAGVTTLGKSLAERLGYPAFDTDDYYWFTDDALPYRRKRNPDHRRALLSRALGQADNWVLSGALCGWGDMFIPQFDLVVYLWLPVETRLARIKDRETARYGADRLAQGGDLQLVFEKFMHWAASYDDAADNARSRKQELQWLEQLSCPVQYLEEEMEVEKVVEALMTTIRPKPLT